MAQSINSTPTGYINADRLSGFVPSHNLSALGKRRPHVNTTPSRFTPRFTRSPASSTGSRMSGMAETFQLPDVNNLTALVGEESQPGTPFLSSDGRAHWLHQARQYRDRHPLIQDVPVPADEKAIYASICILKERIAQLEHDKNVAEQRADDHHADLIRLKSEIESEQRYRRSDSALGASEDEGRSDAGLRTANTHLQAEVKTLQHRLDTANAKVAVKDISMKRCLSERDSAMTQLGATLLSVDDLNKEIQALQKENEALREEVLAVRSQNDELHTEQFEIRREMGKTNALAGEANNLRTENNSLKLNALKSERALSENVYLKEQLENMRIRHAEEAQEIRLREGDARRKAEQRAQKALDDQYQLQLTNNNLKVQLENNKHSKQDFDLADTDMEVDYTTRSINIEVDELERAQDQLRYDVRDEKNLQKQLDRITVKHHEHSAQWSRMEQELKAELQRLRIAGSSTTSANRTILSPRKVSKRAQSTTARSSPSKMKNQGRRATMKATAGATGASNSSLAGLRSASAPAGHLNPRSASKLSNVEEVLDIDLSALDFRDDYKVQQRTAKTNTRPALAELRNVQRKPPAARDTRKLPVTSPFADETILSLMDTAEIASIRLELEEERRRRREQRRTEQTSSTGPDRVNAGAIRHQDEADLNRKESARTSILKRKGDDHRTEASLGPSPLRPSKRTAANVQSYHRRSAPDMTSAFILPDITLQMPVSGPVMRHTASTEQTKESCRHDDRDCTVCYQQAAATTQLGQALPPKPVIPVPVLPSEMQNEEDATMRPVLSPAEALAKVLKELEDELVHEKKDLVFVTQILEKHNAALASRKREHYTRKVSLLNESIARKSQHIYDLHDVLEGQLAVLGSAKYYPMTETTGNIIEQVEETLMSVGFEPSEAHQRAMRSKRVVVKSVSDHDSSVVSV